MTAGRRSTRSAAPASSRIRSRWPTGATTSCCAGIEKFRITSEDASRPYRIGHVDALSEVIPPADVQPLRHQRQRLEAVLAAAIERVRAEPKFPPSVPDEDLVNALAQYLELDAVEHQALLECDGVLARCRALIELLEMKIHAPRGGWPGKVFH